MQFSNPQYRTIFICLKAIHLIAIEKGSHHSIYCIAAACCFKRRVFPSGNLCIAKSNNEVNSKLESIRLLPFPTDFRNFAWKWNFGIRAIHPEIPRPILWTIKMLRVCNRYTLRFIMTNFIVCHNLV